MASFNPGSHPDLPESGSPPDSPGIPPSGPPGAGQTRMPGPFVLRRRYDAAVTEAARVRQHAADLQQRYDAAIADAERARQHAADTQRRHDTAVDDAERARQHAADLQQRYDTAVTEARRAEQQAAETQRHAEEQEADYHAMQAELTAAVEHMLKVALPAALDGSSAPEASAESASGLGGGAGELFDRLVSAVTREVAELREQLSDQGESSRRALLKTARQLQSVAHRIQKEATDLSDLHSANHDVLEYSNRVDHAAAMAARKAQSLIVICGEWPGQQWSRPIELLEVARAAAGRILPFQRIAISGEQGIGVAAGAAEALIHLLAEVLANATQSSPTTTEVPVTVRAVQRGAVFEVDDPGLGMADHQLSRAREIVSGDRLIELADLDLGENPQTGLPVMGRYVRRHGFKVGVDPSPYGGVRVVVRVPPELVVTVTPASPPMAAPAPRAAEAGEGMPGEDEGDTGSLPRRRSLRRRPEPLPASHGDLPPAGETPPAQTPAEGRAWVDRFFSAESGAQQGTAAMPDDAQAEGEDADVPGGASSGTPADGDSPRQQD